MKLMDFWDQLPAVFSGIATLLGAAGYDEDQEGLTGLEWDKGDTEAYYYVMAADSIARSLVKAMERYKDACCLPDTHAYTLHRLPDGRYGFYKGGYVIEMYCGRSVEALLDRDGFLYWTRCTFEHDGDYYIPGHYDASLEGLVVRKAREGSDW